MSNAISVQSLSKRFGDHQALDRVSFEVPKGAVVGLIGPNGAGKTTALKAILGLSAFEGTVEVLGESPRSAPHQMMTSVGYILGNFINGLLVGRVGVVRMAYIGSLLTVLVPLLMLAGGLTGLLTPLWLSFLCFCFGVCNGLVIANAMICSMRAAGSNSGAGTGLLGAMQMLFGGVAGSTIIALGGADHFSVTATGLLIMALCAALSSFLAPNSR